MEWNICVYIESRISLIKTLLTNLLTILLLPCTRDNLLTNLLIILLLPCTRDTLLTNLLIILLLPCTRDTLLYFLLYPLTVNKMYFSIYKIRLIVNFYYIILILN